jgi:hypothetical protein
VHPAQGLTTEVSFIFEIKGEGRFPIGEKLGSGIMTKYSHGIIDAASRDSISTATGQFIWWVHGSRITGYNILTGFTAS